jgi:hypothetical protein
VGKKKMKNKLQLRTAHPADQTPCYPEKILREEQLVAVHLRWWDAPDNHPGLDSTTKIQLRNFYP